MDRRKLIKTAAGIVAAASLLPKISKVAIASAVSETSKSEADIVVVRNASPERMFQKGIAELGGMKKFVSPGQNVIIKVNSSFDRTPEFAATTNPELVAEVVRQALAAGAAKVEVFDHTINDPKNSFKNSGIEQAVKKAGGTVLDANDDANYVEVSKALASKMKSAMVFKPMLDADVFINIPILKHHGGAKMSAAIKHLMGVVWDRRAMHSNDLAASIADALFYVKPDLNVVDAYRVITQNGPRGITLSDVEDLKYQLISTDIVAVDAASAKIMGYQISDVPYIGHAAKLGFGESDTSKLNIKRIEG